MLYTYAPKSMTCVPRLGIEGPGVYDISKAEADALNERIDGKDGKPALVPVESQADAPKAAPKADSKPEPKPAKGKAAPSTPAPGVEVT